MNVTVSCAGGSVIRRILVMAGIVSLLLAGLASGSSVAKPKGAPKLDARSWILIDARTGEELAGHNENKHLLMASTTKLMTAYLTIRSLPMSKMVTAPDYPATPGESLMELEAGQRVSVRDLLYGLILRSGNDAAVALAGAVSGSIPRFVERMNRAARGLGLNDTHYENPIGLDGKSQYTSARDLASLSRTLMGIARFRKIASSRTAKLTSYRPPVRIETINHFLLNNSWAKGIKTGHTTKARYILASDGRRRATELIGAVIGAPTEESRDVETVKLLDFGFSLYRKRLPIRRGRTVVEVPVRYDDDLGLVSRRPVRIGLRKEERAVVTPVVPAELEGPIARGTHIGRATVTVDGDRIATVPLFAAAGVEKPTIFDKLSENVMLVALCLVAVLFVILGCGVWMRHRRQSRARKRLRRVSRRTR